MVALGCRSSGSTVSLPSGHTALLGLDLPHPQFLEKGRNWKTGLVLPPSNPRVRAFGFLALTLCCAGPCRSCLSQCELHRFWFILCWVSVGVWGRRVLVSPRGKDSGVCPSQGVPGGIQDAKPQDFGSCFERLVQPPPTAPQKPQSLSQKAKELLLHCILASHSWQTAAGLEAMIPVYGTAPHVPWVSSDPSSPPGEPPGPRLTASTAAFAGTNPLPAASPPFCPLHRCDAQRLCCRLRFY